MKLFLCVMLLSTSVLAKFPLIDIQRMSGEYVEGEGKAYAEKAFYVIPKAKISHEQIEIDFSKLSKSILIKDPSTSVELEYDFSFLDVLKAFSFNELNIKSTDKLFTIVSDVFDIYIDPTKYHIEKFLVETDVRNIPTSDAQDISILDGIILNGRLEAKKMQFKDFDLTLFDDLRLENPGHKQEITKVQKSNKLSIPMIVRHMKFKADEGRIVGKALMDSYINLWFRVWATMKTNKRNSELIITVNKAKLGIFSIRSTLLKAIARLKLDKVNVDVKRRTITIDLKSIVFGGGDPENTSLKVK